LRAETRKEESDDACSASGSVPRSHDFLFDTASLGRKFRIRKTAASTHTLPDEIPKRMPVKIRYAEPRACQGAHPRQSCKFPCFSAYFRDGLTPPALPPQTDSSSRHRAQRSICRRGCPRSLAFGDRGGISPSPPHSAPSQPVHSDHALFASKLHRIYGRFTLIGVS
jgi:hypothetical protein